MEGGNAEASGEVKVGDVLRATTAVMKGREKVTVGKFQVEPSLAQRQQVIAQLTHDDCTMALDYSPGLHHH